MIEFYLFDFCRWNKKAFVMRNVRHGYFLFAKRSIR